MEALRSIVYISMAVRPMSETELEGLLVEARALNLETNTTGVLLYSAGTFMQCFEGSEAAVALTYDRIKASRRHRDIVELIDGPIAARSFKDWQMGFWYASQSELLALSSAQWQRRLGAPPLGTAVSAGMTLLGQFWRQARR